MAGRPTPRSPKARPTNAAVALVAMMIFAVLALAVSWALSHDLPTEAEQRPEHVITHDSLAPTYTYDGEVIRWYVLTDPDTGVQYLTNDRGGTTPRLDRYGRIMGVEYDG